MHQGWGLSAGSSTVVQPVQVIPMKIKGKLHSGSAPDMVEHVEVVEETPEIIANKRRIKSK